MAEEKPGKRYSVITLGNIMQCYGRLRRVPARVLDEPMLRMHGFEMKSAEEPPLHAHLRPPIPKLGRCEQRGIRPNLGMKPARPSQPIKAAAGPEQPGETGKAAPVLSEFLTSPEEGRRVVAAWSCRVLVEENPKNPEMPALMPALIKALEDGCERVRANAAVALTLMKDERAIPGLVGLLDRESMSNVSGGVMIIALNSLKELACENPDLVKAAPILYDVLDNYGTPQNVRVRAYETLEAIAQANYQNPELISAILRLAGETERVDNLMRMAAAAACGIIAQKEPRNREIRAQTDNLMAALRDKDPGVRGKAAWALGIMKEPGAIRGLVRLLKDRDAGIRAVSAWSLSEILRQCGSWQLKELGLLGTAISRLVKMLRDKEFGVLGEGNLMVVVGAFSALHEIGAPAIPALTKLLKKEGMRETATNLLAAIENVSPRA